MWTHSTRTGREGRTLTGLALADLAASFPREVVRFVLGSEIDAGRVVEDAGLFRIIPKAFDRETLLALQTLGPEKPDRPSCPRRRDLGVTRDDPTTTYNPEDSGGAEAGRRAEDAA